MERRRLLIGARPHAYSRGGFCLHNVIARHLDGSSSYHVCAVSCTRVTFQPAKSQPKASPPGLSKAEKAKIDTAAQIACMRFAKASALHPSTVSSSGWGFKSEVRSDGSATVTQPFSAKNSFGLDQKSMLIAQSRLVRVRDWPCAKWRGHLASTGLSCGWGYCVAASGGEGRTHERMLAERLLTNRKIDPKNHQHRRDVCPAERNAPGILRFWT